MVNHKKLWLLFILILSLAVSGCWDRRELDALALATCVGIDKAEEPDKIQMTVELILPQNVSTPGGGGGQGPPTFNIQAQGRTIFETARKLTLESEEKVYFAHNPVLLFSEEVAKEGLHSVLDFFIRDPEHRRTAWMLVTEEKTQDIISVQTILEPITGLYIDKLVEETATTSLVAKIMVQGFLERLMSPTTCPYCPLIKVKEEDKKRSMELTGTAIFKKDKMVGKFDLREGRGLLWVLGEVKTGIINVPCGEEQVALEIIRSQSKVTPAIIDNTLKITIKIREEGHLGEQRCTADLTTPGAWKGLEKKQAEAIRQEILAAVKKAQELNTDVFGFGDSFHRKYPVLWREQLEKNWDEFFPELEVEVLVEAKLRRTGMTTKPAIPQ